MNDTHIETWNTELAASADTEWDRWIERLERTIGHSADGDQDADGYSIDWCFDMFNCGRTVTEIAAHIADVRRPS